MFSFTLYSYAPTCVKLATPPSEISEISEPCETYEHGETSEYGETSEHDKTSETGESCEPSDKNCLPGSMMAHGVIIYYS